MRIARQINVLLALALLFALATVSYGADPKPAPRTGTFSDTLKGSGGGELIMKYKARVPEKLPEAKTLGLIVAFHGRTLNENSMFGPTVNPLKQLGVLDQYVVLCGKSRGVGWTRADRDPTMAFIQWAIKTYPIDPRRVHLIGFSSGAFMVTGFGWPNQQHFATITAWCGASSTRWGKRSPIRRKGSGAEAMTEFYFVHGDSDRIVPVAMTRGLCKELKGYGCRYIYREMDGHHHTSIFREKFLYRDIFQWIHATRNKVYPLGKADKKTLLTMKFKIRTMKGPQALTLVAEAARIGGPVAGASLIYAIRSADAEVRLAAIKSAASTSYGSALNKELARRITDKDPAIRAAAITALGNSARWRHLDAQAILAKAVVSRAAADADRLAIIAELGKIFDLMVLGNMEDGLIPATLVKLLADPKEPIRAAAFEHLKKAVPDGLSYSPDGEPRQRRLSIVKWKAWVTSATQKPLDGGYKHKPAK